MRYFLAFLILMLAILAFGKWQFNRQVNAQLVNFCPATLPKTEVITEASISLYPAIVKQWLQRSKIIGKEMVQTVHLKQIGSLKTKPDADWMPFEAEQWNTVKRPGFLWRAYVRMAPGIYLDGLDKYENGQGHMLIKALSLFPVVNSSGPTIDQGTLLRNLAEISWFPSAALSEYIQWEPVDSLSARATMTCGEVTASGMFYFNSDADLIRFEAQRYFDRSEGPTLEKWIVTNQAFKDFHGVRIPYQSEVSWDLPSGMFTWAKMEVTEIEYNQSCSR